MYTGVSITILLYICTSMSYDVGACWKSYVRAYVHTGHGTSLVNITFTCSPLRVFSLHFFHVITLFERASQHFLVLHFYSHDALLFV